MLEIEIRVFLGADQVDLAPRGKNWRGSWSDVQSRGRAAVAEAAALGKLPERITFAIEYTGAAYSLAYKLPVAGSAEKTFMETVLASYENIWRRVEKILAA